VGIFPSKPLETKPLSLPSNYSAAGNPGKVSIYSGGRGKPEQLKDQALELKAAFTATFVLKF
jgi:hypothetical protein